MQTDETKSWSNEIVAAVTHSHLAHAEHSNTPQDAVRFHDRLTPYIVHPLWCATALLQEAALPVNLRRIGYVALLWHDTLEDTSSPLPAGTSSEVAELVEQMSFASFDEERAELWGRSSEIKLFKLYDKVSNLLDGIWMKTEKWNIYVDHTLRLANEVEKKFGVLNIVKIARAIATPK